MFQFTWYSFSYLCIQYEIIRYESDGVAPFGDPRIEANCGSPGLIAAFHVLHRLYLPSHSL